MKYHFKASLLLPIVQVEKPTTEYNVGVDLKSESARFQALKSLGGFLNSYLNEN